MSSPKTYSEAGVDFSREGKGISALVRGILEFRKGHRTGLGSQYSMEGQFAGLIDFGDYALSLCTDGVGTKIMIAEAIGKFDTVGIDCIAMNVNDMICIGAEPLAFVDYLAMNRVDDDITYQIGQGLGKGAEMANIEIIGGETATLPDMVRGVDLAGTALGYVRKGNIITGEAIREGDALISLASTGFHSNGYTLVRKVVEGAGYTYTDPLPDPLRDIGAGSIGEALLEPTAIYVKEVLAMLREYREYVHGMANITGGGVKNLNRLKKGTRIVIDTLPERSPLFDWIQELAGIADREMFMTFNMGMGFVIAAEKSLADDIVAFLRRKSRYSVDIIGHVERIEGQESSVTVSPIGEEYIGY